MYHKCDVCEYNSNCQLQAIAPDITGCSGHSKYSTALIEKARIEREELEEKRRIELEKQKKLLSELKVGDRVELYLPVTMILGARLPRYIEGSALTVIGFNRNGKAICDYDGGKPFHIPVSALRVIEE